MLRILLAVGLAISSPVFAQETASKIIMYRPGSVVGMALACPIRYEGKEVVELGRNKYAEWTVQPGRYILMNKTASIEVAVGAGETRYVRCAIKTGFLSGRADLQISDEATFKAKFNEFERKDVNAEFMEQTPIAAN
jgi:hypothetical protein